MTLHRTDSVWGAGGGTGLTALPLIGDATCDVCIIGAGMAGVCTAYHLVHAERSVVVLDANDIGSGETGLTTAHLATALDAGYVRLSAVHGVSGARLAAESHGAAIDRIEALVREEGIHCDFERTDGYLCASPSTPEDGLRGEMAAALAAGVSVRWLDRGPLGGAAIHFPRQGQFHPLKFLRGLATIARRRGCRFYGGARVVAIDKVGNRARVRTAGGEVVDAGTVVVATNAPFNLISVHAKQAAFRTYAIATPVASGRVGHGLVWDTEDPFHYVRVGPPIDRSGRDVIIVGGEDHHTGIEPEGDTHPWERLTAWAHTYLSDFGEPEWRWSGQVVQSMDGLAFIGPVSRSPDIHIVTGDCGNGITHGMIAGLLITDFEVRRENPWRTLYDPNRLHVRALGEAARQGLNFAAQRLGEVFTSANAANLGEIRPDTGAIVQGESEKLAVYRDLDGRLSACSAVCPHLGCVVAWNPAERSWDCPCHGSRFDADGTLLNGPATQGLRRREVPADEPRHPPVDP